MRKILALLTVCVVLAATQALALEQPTITSPQEGAILGPNYEVVGSMPYRAFLVVVTDLVRCDTNEVLYTVPGIRHWTNEDGSFRFRVASPRVIVGGSGMDLQYRVRVYEANRNENGPEAHVIAQCTPGQVTASLVQGEGGLMLSAPQEGASLGPNYDVIGRMPQRAFLVVVTDVINSETGEVVGTVPGIRHWTDMDGSFHFRVSSPRIMLGQRGLPLSYRVRIFESGAEGNGPETVINAKMAE